MKVLVLLGALALGPGSGAVAAAPRSLAEDVAEIATRVCFEVESGRLRWNPADLAAEEALFKSLGLKPGIPGGILDGFTRNVASTFNSSVLAHRANGASHVLVAIGGRMPGCRVSVAGAPGVVSASEVAKALERKAYGWTALPEFNRTSGPIDRLSFGRRTEGGGNLRLDLLEVTVARDNFRLMAMIMGPPEAPKRPAGY